MFNKKVIIIGAGIAGLSAGCYLQMNGYETEIFELHSIAGGLCTAWKKGGYTFDGCIHTIGGLNPKYRLNQWWKELIDLEQMEFYFHTELCQVVDRDGKVVRLSTDLDKLEAELKSIALQDAKFIENMISAVRNLSKYDTQLAKPLELWNPLDYYLSQFRTAPYIRTLMDWHKSLRDCTQNCHSPLLKNALNSDFFSHFPAYFFLFSLASMYNKNAGYPIGGSLPLALALEKKYLSLGGKIHFNARVTKINVKNDCAIGVTLANGEVHTDADLIVSAADGHDTIFNLLEGKYINKKVEKLYSEHPMWDSAVLVSLGVARTFENEPEQLELALNDPLVIDEHSKLVSLPVTIYNFDPTLAEKGKTCLRSILKTGNYQYWCDLRENDLPRYEQEKERIADGLIDILDRHLGNVAKHVEVVDVATPATFVRYTNNWKGSIQGWDWLPGLIPETIKKELPGLKKFYMIGQWVMPGGGVTSGLTMGRDLARIICARDHRKFQPK